MARAGRSRFVLLGEKHDNPDHHRLQAWVLDRLVRSGRRPAVALEMLDSTVEEDLRRHRDENPGDVDGIRTAVRWDESGWPPWAVYRPIAEVAVRSGLELVPANLARDDADRVAREGFGVLPGKLRERMGLDAPLPDAVGRALRDEIYDAHCRMLPESALEGMVRVQRARDAWMTDRLLASAPERGAVLIAGTGHVRRDRGVAALLTRHAGPGEILAVAFLEVPDPSGTEDEPEGIREERFDVIWYTPRSDAEDPCERFREQLERAAERLKGGEAP